MVDLRLSAPDSELVSYWPLNGTLADPALGGIARDASITVSAWFRVDRWSGRWEALLAKGRGNNYSISHQSLDPRRLALHGAA